MADACKTLLLQNVLIQENGIIRGPDGYIIGRLCDNVDIDSLKQATKREHGDEKRQN